MSTIAAISTSPGIGGIGIVRISGKDAFKVLNKIFKPKNNSEIKGYTMKYGNIIDTEKNKIIDEVLVSYFIAPKSYTTENMCEINSHGGVIVMKQILDLCLKNGATLAEPGEFTKRAFLNGRIDLVEAEAIIDIINAKTEKEKDASVCQLNGFLSKEIIDIEKDLLSFTADIEANIDYPEYDIEEVSTNKSLEVLKNVKNKLLKLKESFNNGKILKEGINTAIDKVIDLGKSFIGIFNGDFQKVSQVEIAVQKGGLIDEMSDLFDKALENIKERDYISAKLNNIIKGGKDIVESRLDENIKSVLKEQNKIIDNIDKCIENWNTYKTENDFEKMELEYEKIKKQAESIIPLEETLQKLKELDNLHNYIKNNNQNCNISNIELELARKL